MLKYWGRIAGNRVGGALKRSFTLWVRYNNYPPVNLKFETGNVDELKDVVKDTLLDLSNISNGKIILRKHEDTVALEPGVIIDESFKNTCETPLQVSIIIGKSLRWSTQTRRV